MADKDEGLVTAKLFNSVVKKFSADQKTGRTLEKKRAVDAKKEADGVSAELKKLNDQIKKGEYIRSKEYDDAKKRQEEIRNQEKQVNQHFGNFSETAKDLREQNKEEKEKLEKIIEQNGAMLNTEGIQAKRQGLLERRQKSQELVDEEKNKERNFIFKGMLKGIRGLEKGIGNAFKNVGKAGWVGFKAALLATGILLLLRFLESKKWQEIKNWLKKEGKEIFDTLTTALGAMWKYFAGPDSIFKRIAKIMKSINEIFNPTRVDHTGMSPGAMGGKLKEKAWWTRVGDAWNTMMDNLGGWEFALIAGLTAIGGYFIYKPLRMLYKVGKGLTTFGKDLFTHKKYGLFTGMTWVKNWIKGFGEKFKTAKQGDLFKQPAKGWLTPIKDGFLNIISKFKNALRIAVASAGGVLSTLTKKLPGAVVTGVEVGAPIAKRVQDMWTPAKKWVGEAGAKVGTKVAGTGAKIVSQVPDWIKSPFRPSGGGPLAKTSARLLKTLSTPHTPIGLPAGGGPWAHVTDAMKMGAGGGGKASKLAKFLKWGKAVKIPGISLIVGAGLAGMYAAEGKLGRAGLELLSGALGTFPGVGTALAYALDAGMLASDLDGTNVGKDFDKFSKAYLRPDKNFRNTKKSMAAIRASGQFGPLRGQGLYKQKTQKQIVAELEAQKKRSLNRAMAASGYSMTDLEGYAKTSTNPYLQEILASSGIGAALDKEGLSGNKVLINQDNSTTLTSGMYWPMVNPEPQMHTGSIYSRY